jgi:phospholipid/cholesterol/gamma-HCH transport system permease protein
MAKPAPTLEAASPGSLSFQENDSTLVIGLSGRWSVESGLPPISEVEQRLGGIRRIAFDTSGLESWDSGLLALLTKIMELARARHIDVDLSILSPGIRRLVELAEAVPERKDARRKDIDRPLLEDVGVATIKTVQGTRTTLAFLGELVLSYGRLFTFRARFRAWDMWLFIQEAGPKALPIVTLISFLSGVILAFVGAVQLRMFGGQIYIADLVAIGMTREMGALMTAVIMAGRTGASFAAQLGTMKVTQEIDAFKAMGFEPMDFLVLPRVTALTAMMPLLTLYADLVGMIGGAFIGIGMLDITFASYYVETTKAITITYVMVGLFKSVVYGSIIAFFGCLRGINTGNSSSAVGDATTSAVVSSIVFCVVANGIMAVLSYVLNV